jgi:hypothetical protein
MGERDDLQPPHPAELEKQIDNQVSRNAEEMGNTDFLEVGDQVIA